MQGMIVTASKASPDAPREALPAIRRGLRCRCPNCGTGRMFGRYLKVEPVCTDCSLNLDGHQADDMPPYIVIMIVGHLIIGLYMAVDAASEWPLWLHNVVWPALTLVSALALLQPVKGALIAYQWALKMHGFDPALRRNDPADSKHTG